MRWSATLQWQTHRGSKIWAPPGSYHNRYNKQWLQAINHRVVCEVLASLKLPTFQLVPREELVSAITDWLDSKTLLLRLRWQCTWGQRSMMCNIVDLNMVTWFTKFYQFTDSCQMILMNLSNEKLAIQLPHRHCLSVNRVPLVQVCLLLVGFSIAKHTETKPTTKEPSQTWLDSLYWIVVD